MGQERKLRIPDLVVIVGSFLLGALAIGATQEVSRRHARELGCMANLRQWGGIFQDYLQRDDGKFLPGHSWYWLQELDDEHKDRHKMKIWLCPRADKPIMDEDRNRIRESIVFSAWGIEKGDDFGPTGLAGSYGLNGYSRARRPGRKYAKVKGTAFDWRAPKVQGSARIPLFIDALRFDLWPLATEGPPEKREQPWAGNHMARSCIDRHKGAVNCLFMDWSVRRVGLKELWTLKWHRQFDTAGPWTKAGGVQPEDWPEWMRGYKDY